MISRLLFILIFFSSNFSFGQETNIVRGDIIVKLDKSTKIESFCRTFKQSKNIDFEIYQCLSQSANIWLIKFDAEAESQSLVLNEVKAHNSVLIAQNNHTDIVLRTTTPNDPQFGSQWDMDQTSDVDIDAPEAWDISTGGLTTQGDEIVVAIVDDGFDTNHEDLVPNLWVNVDEVAGNGIDDDNNGYIDDINGWNAYNNNGTLTSQQHGTHVSGTVGARGNNSIGVTGVNWEVKLMMIQGSSGVESTVVAAYGYVLDERTLYNNTDGAQGSFVVSTNASFGVDNGDPANYPLWCDMYDDLGQQGVISAGATANANVDVDVVGDVPTTCASDYMIAVTNTTSTDQLNGGAAFGAINIDLGAPGTGILSTVPGNGYQNLTGTSMATPHVAGAVGLLVAAACDDFITNYKNDPATYALQLKDAIMNGTDPIPALNGITVSGGRLNLYNAIDELNPGTDGQCVADFVLSTTESNLNVCAPNDATFTIDVESILGYTDPVSLSIAGAPAGTTSSFSVNPVTPGGSAILTVTNIDASMIGDYTLTVTGTATTTPKTLNLELTIEDGAPGSVVLNAPIDGATNVPLSTSLTWDPTLGASSYLVELTNLIDFSNILETSTTSATSFTPSITLDLNTNYYWRVTPSNECGTGNISDSFIFTTQGVVYCSSNGQDSSEEWIGSIEIGTIINTSGDNGGYGDFTAMTVSADIGETVNFTLTPEWAGTTYNEYWMIWIDYNENGDFTDPGENVYDAGAANSNVQNGSFVIPAGTTPGSKRIRVTMKYDAIPTPCESFDFGEVEDYTLNVISSGGCPSDVIESGVYSAGTIETIQSSTYINSDAIISADASITYDATNCIELLNGFEVLANGEFEVVIGGCVD